MNIQKLLESILPQFDLNRELYDGGYSGRAFLPMYMHMLEREDYRKSPNEKINNSIDFIMNFNPDYTPKSGKEYSEYLYNYLVLIHNDKKALALANNDVKLFNNLIELQKFLKKKGFLKEDLVYYHVDGDATQDEYKIGAESIAEDYRWIKKKESEEIAKKIANKLNISGNLERLGHGEYGWAYGFNDKVIKLTTDKTEASASLKLLNKNNKFIADIYGVYKFKHNKTFIYVILLEKLDTSKKNQLRDYSDQLDQILWGNFRTHYHSFFVNEYVENRKHWDEEVSDHLFNEILEHRPELRKFFKQLILIYEELKLNGIRSYDFFSIGNLGYKKDGRLGFFDLGYSNQDNNIPDINVNEKTSVHGTVNYGENGELNEIMIKNDVIGLFRIDDNQLKLNGKDIGRIYLSKRNFDGVDYYSLEEISIFPESRGKRYFSRFMVALIKKVKEENGVLSLTPFSLDTENMSTEQIKQIYLRIGFKKNAGKVKDFRVIDSLIMRFDNKKNEVNERDISFMPDSQSVKVKKKCKLGGNTDGTSEPCNKGDMNNLELKKI